MRLDCLYSQRLRLPRLSLRPLCLLCLLLFLSRPVVLDLRLRVWLRPLQRVDRLWGCHHVHHHLV